MRDLTRERSVLLNQMLFAGVVFASIFIVLALDPHVAIDFLVGGTALVGLGCALALLVPWNRVANGWIVVLPVIDIIAVSCLRQGSLNSGIGLLWSFPAMWIAGSFGVGGVIIAVVAITSAHWASVLLDPKQTITAYAVMLPLAIATLATVAYLTARRGAAQRYLLDRQSDFLGHSLVRARRQENLVTEILDAVDFGIIRITPDGQLVVTNDAHGRLLRGSAGQTQLFAADGVHELAPELIPLERAQRGEVFENQVVWYGVPGGGGRALSVTSRQLRELDGSPAGMIIVTRDVTAEELALRSREDLVASVSHELRTPLTSIIGYLDLALDGDGIPDDARERLDIAERNASRLLELVSDILASSAQTRGGGELPVTLETIEVAPVVRAAIESMVPRAVERRIVIDGSGIEDATAYADAHRIRQVLDNLVSNAVKYNHDGGRVVVRVAQDGLFTWISVADNGQGIAEEELPRLFERFFRSDQVRNTGTHGSGLGLAISRDIVRAHGGEITVRTALGQGSTFLVRLLSNDPRGEH